MRHGALAAVLALTLTASAAIASETAPGTPTTTADPATATPTLAAAPAARPTTNTATNTATPTTNAAPATNTAANTAAPATNTAANTTAANTTAANNVATAALAPQHAPNGNEPAAASNGTPLATRLAPQPLTLAPKEESTPFGYKLLAILGIAGAAGAWFHAKKKGGLFAALEKKTGAKIDVLGRQSVGVRNELLVVDVEGTRLLVGMTPGAIQTLAVLDGEGATVPNNTDATEVNAELKAAMAERPTIERIGEPQRKSGSSAPAASAAADEDDDMPPPVSVVPAKPRTLAPTTQTTTTVAALDQKVRTLLATRPAEPVKAAAPAPAPVNNGGSKRRRGNSKTARIAGQAKGLLLAMNAEESSESARAGDA